MAGWAALLLGLGILSYLLPLFGYQFVLVAALGDNGGLICIGAGVALFVLAAMFGRSDP